MIYAELVSILVAEVQWFGVVMDGFTVYNCADVNCTITEIFKWGNILYGQDWLAALRLSWIWLNSGSFDFTDKKTVAPSGVTVFIWN